MVRSVIPPYILNKIISNGACHQQSCARNTLQHVQTLMATPPGKANASRKSQPGQVVREIYDAHHSQNLPGTLVRSDAQRCAAKQ